MTSIPLFASIEPIPTVLVNKRNFVLKFFFLLFIAVEWRYVIFGPMRLIPPPLPAPRPLVINEVFAPYHPGTTNVGVVS